MFLVWGFCFLLNFLQDGRTALHFSANSGSEGKEKMTVLLENGADVNSPDCVSFNWNEKDETDVSVYAVESENTAAYVCI